MDLQSSACIWRVLSLAEVLDEKRAKFCAVRRLSKAAAYLERLDESCGDPTIETRIIWRELLDLELSQSRSYGMTLQFAGGMPPSQALTSVLSPTMRVAVC